VFNSGEEDTNLDLVESSDDITFDDKTQNRMEMNKIGYYYESLPLKEYHSAKFTLKNGVG
jgi:hypothetical protein